jgi:hypothetical protein
MPVFIGK